MHLGVGRKLAELGVLGINRRNASYTLQYNERCSYPLVDDKLQTKELAQRAGMSVPKLYSVVTTAHEIQHLHSFLTQYPDFVVKPARGSGGDGIMVISGRMKDMYRTVTGELVTEPEFQYHVLNVLSGIFSLSGLPDKALVEYRVQFDPLFEAISYKGVPDIRIIVFLGVPVMAMVRLPTRLSRGKANLHQGAIGAGIDMASGTTRSAVWRDQIISEHPDTGNSIAGITIPYWKQLLELSARCYELTGLGYQGVDIVLDKDLGPMVLELNARPGLNIQIANRDGLLHRLELVERSINQLETVEQRVVFSQSCFITLNS
jgi:alpha-L-glutamate ligase-like protein